MPRFLVQLPKTTRSFAARLAPAFACVASLFAPAPSRAEAPRPAALAWTRAPGAEQCPSGPAIAAEVERVLAGRPLVSIAQADIVVEGRITRAGDAFESVLTLVGRDGAVLGTRRITTAGPECAAVRAEVGLVIALMIDPDAVLRPGPPASSATPPPGPVAAVPPVTTGSPLPGTPTFTPPAPGELSADDEYNSHSIAFSSPPSSLTPAAPPCPPAPPPPPVPWRTHLSAGPLLGFGLLPSPSAGARVRLAVTPPRVFPFELSGDLLAPVRVELDGTGLEVFTAQARLRACPLTGTFAPFSLVACGGFDFGALRGGGFGFPVNRASETFTAAASLAGRVQLRLAGIFLVSLGLDLAVPFIRARFSYAAPEGGRRELFLTSPVTGSADLGLGVEM